MAKLIDLYVDQGSEFEAFLPPVTSSDGTVFDLTNYTASCQFRRSYATANAVQLDATVVSPAQGTIRLNLSHLLSAVLTPTRYVYDVVITDLEGNVTKVFEGLATVNPGVSTKPNPTLLTPFIPEDYGGL